MAHLRRAAISSGRIKKLILALLLGSALTSLVTLRLINELDFGERDWPATSPTVTVVTLPSETTFTRRVKTEAIGNVNAAVLSAESSSRQSMAEFFDATENKSTGVFAVDQKIAKETQSSSSRKLNTLKDGPEKYVSHLEDPRWLSQQRNYIAIAIIFSSVGSVGIVRRAAIRATWLSAEMLGEAPFTYWFVLGVKNVSSDHRIRLRKEQAAHGDLLMLQDIYNSYENLSERTLRSMHYISTHYNFAYFLKTDDDMFLNMPVLFHEMKHTKPRKRLYWGSFSCYNPPQTEGRWLEARWHSCDVYYPYAYGGMYILTSDVVNLVANNAPYLQLYANEDVSMGGWLAPYNLYRLNDARIYVQHERRCSRGFIAIHGNTGWSWVLKMYEKLKTKGVVCSNVMTMEFLSWDGLPQECNLKTERIG